MGVSVQRGDELGHLLVALDPPEGPLGVDHSGCGPAQYHLRVLTVGDVAVGGPRDRDHRVDRVGADQGLGQPGPSMPNWAMVNISSKPSRSEAAG
jgi:hypothetical protein